jgi:hypothetical protein
MALNGVFGLLILVLGFADRLESVLGGMFFSTLHVYNGEPYDRLCAEGSQGGRAEEGMIQAVSKAAIEIMLVHLVTRQYYQGVIAACVEHAANGTWLSIKDPPKKLCRD